MDSGQIIVKTVLIAVCVLVAILVVVPGRGTRGVAIQRLALLFVAIAGVLSVVFPHATTQLANLLGIGRGVDLMLYGLSVLFIGFAIRMTLRVRRMDRDLTVLARKISLIEANAHEAHDTVEDTGAIDLRAIRRVRESRGVGVRRSIHRAAQVVDDDLYVQGRRSA